MMNTKLLIFFTRTPLHVGAGLASGPIDRPMQRERHTGFPIIPGATIKGIFASLWSQWVPTKDQDGKESIRFQRQAEEAWLFGSGDVDREGAGSLQFSEGKLLAFPVRSAKGSFAWITSPLLLRRFAREGGLPENLLPSHSPRDDQAMFTRTGPLAISATSECRIVLEEYVFFFAGELPATREGSTPGAPGRPATPSQGTNLGAYLETLLTGDSVWKEVVNRLVIVSDGMMSFFCQSACEVAQHVAIDDGSGLARPGTLYNQENVPSDTMFYGCLNCFADRIKNRSKDESRLADEVLAAKLQSRGNVLQFGADASTGLGLCTVELKDPWQKAE